MKMILRICKNSCRYPLLYICGQGAVDIKNNNMVNAYSHSQSSTRLSRCSFYSSIEGSSNGLDSLPSGNYKSGMSFDFSSFWWHSFHSKL